MSKEALPFQNVHDTIARILNAGLPTQMGKPGWTYKDLRPISVEEMVEFKRIVGEENIHWITYSEYSGNRSRGQLLISPEGMRRVEDFVALYGDQFV